MGHALEPEGSFRLAAHHEAEVGLGRIGLELPGSEPNPAWNDDRTLCVVLEGEIYNGADLRRCLADAGCRAEARSPAELCLRLYEVFGECFGAKLNGAFALVIWDRPARKLRIVNDRMGLFPVYYAEVNGDLLFASGVRALLADPRLLRTVDAVAVHEFLVFDHLLDDRTLLDAVRLLPQASILTFREGRMNIRPYWTLRYPGVYERRTETDCVDGLVERLRQAVERQKPDDQPAGVLLSGGLDSRLLLGLLREESGEKLTTLTFGIPGCDDARVAREVAARLGTEHHFFELKPGWLVDLAEEAVRVTDGMGNIVNLHVLANIESQSRYAQVLYKGFMGDALLGFALKRQMWADYPEGVRYGVHMGVHREQGVLNYEPGEEAAIFTDAFLAEAGDGAWQSYREGMDRSGVSQLANQRLYFDLTQRVPRMTLNGVEAARSRAIVRLPFCDNDLVDFVLGVPPGFLFERRLVKEALVRHFPSLAKIPVAGTGRPLRSCARDVLVQFRQLVSWHLRESGLGRWVPRERRPYKDYDNWFRTVLRAWTEGILLAPRALDRGYFRPDFVRRLVAEHAAGQNHAVRLGALLTLELWHRQFVD